MKTKAFHHLLKTHRCMDPLCLYKDWLFRNFSSWSVYWDDTPKHTAVENRTMMSFTLPLVAMGSPSWCRHWYEVTYLNRSVSLLSCTSPCWLSMLDKPFTVTCRMKKKDLFPRTYSIHIDFITEIQCNAEMQKLFLWKKHGFIQENGRKRCAWWTYTGIQLLNGRKNQWT